MDVLTTEQRHYNMSRIHSKNTKPELIVRKFLWSKGFRYRLQRKGLPGKPDIVLPRFHMAIFINGCFWHMHKCKKFVLPSTNTEFWYDKLSQNKKRDTKNYRKLKKAGWNYIVIWECQLSNNKKRVLEKLHSKLRVLMEKQKNKII
jgi:DNA mismatch endonuclease (patch repair protein)